MNAKLFDFIKTSPTAYHAAKNAASTLGAAGAVRLYEKDAWTLESGKTYYVMRNSSSLISFKIPDGKASGFMIAAAHSDSPAFKLKDKAQYADGNFVKLSNEVYGGMIYSTWLDRPLSIAGRVVVKTERGVEERLVDFGAPVCIIPSVAIHMNRKANEGAMFNPAVDLVPLAGLDCGFSVKDEAAKLAGVECDDVLSHDLFIYNPQDCKEFAGLITAPRLDDLECAFAALEAFALSSPDGAVPVCCLFDNEEVGSMTKQGAASAFFSDVLERIASALGMTDEELKRTLSSSLMLSCDNAHALHPNHPEYADKNNAVVMNGGVVIKYNASQRYTTDAVSSALFKVMCEGAGVPTQSYANRSDIPGGSTLGAMSVMKVSINSADIGLAQLAMHSSYETAGAKDLEYMVKALEKFFSSSVEQTGDGKYAVR